MQQSVVTIFLIGFVVCVTSRHVIREAPVPKYTGIRIIDGLCMNVRTDRLVYRYKNDSYVYIAFDILKTGMVDVFSWTIVSTTKGTFISSKMKKEKVFALDFRKDVNRDHVIAATNKRHQRRFEHRMERKMKHCRKITERKKKHCKLTSIHSVFSRMEMKHVTFGTKPEDCKT
ncbi:uncharacterized protein LOC123535041 [Mercenaria mercenaria]|uniref:uncharacterized protein LOC123535041 n=1 Tax=Mercenaria mercenaria TaxID=6596 RepID=UPI001E1E02FD|nr:uncharacterized protein LOC123535041 [Mercenaria mercenaria]XP_053376312.1 uncharacterized protein LOC123535041 [Mercenaria mercenaria]